MSQISCYQLLNEELEKRKEKYSSYSIRAFARDIGLSKTTVGETLNGMRKLSKQNIDILAKNLNLSPEIVESLKAEKTHSNDLERTILEGDDLSLLEDWQYMAILSLARIPKAKFSADWVAERLMLPLAVAERSLNVLVDKGFIENRNGLMIRKSKALSTTVDVSSSSIVEHHKQSLEKASQLIDQVPLSLRDYTTVTYAINPDKIQDVKDMILTFHRKLGRLLETDKPKEVYRLNIQFFPLTLTSSEE